MLNPFQGGRSFRGAIREETRFRDGLLIATIPLTLLGVFALPRALKMEFVLYYTEPTIHTAFTSHFVHFGVEHLLVNLIAYVMLVPLIYLYWTLSGNRRTFLVVFVVVVIFFPLLLSWVNVSLVRERFGFGFSGLNAAFLGTLPLALTEYLRSEFDMNIGLADAPLFFFVGAAIISLVSVPPSRASVFAALLSIFAAIGYTVLTIRSIDSRGAAKRVVAAQGFGEIAVFGHLLFLLFPFVAFPIAPSGSVPLMNYFIHLLGYAMGFIAPFITLVSVNIR